MALTTCSPVKTPALRRRIRCPTWKKSEFATLTLIGLITADWLFGEMETPVSSALGLTNLALSSRERPEKERISPATRSSVVGMALMLRSGTMRLVRAPTRRRPSGTDTLV